MKKKYSQFSQNFVEVFTRYRTLDALLPSHYKINKVVLYLSVRFEHLRPHRLRLDSE